MINGQAAVFLSCSEAFKPGLGRALASELASSGVQGVLVSDAPLLIGDDASPDGKVERYLDVSDAFVALCTPDDRLRDGRIHCRQNVIDEIQRARQKAHLRRRVMIFKDVQVTLPSNIGLTYTSFEAASTAGIGNLVLQQLAVWQVLGASTEATHESDVGKESFALGTGRRSHVWLLSNLADPVTIEILKLLLERPRAQKHLVAEIGVASSTISRRIGSLEDLGLVRRDGLRAPCYLPLADETRRLLAASMDLASKIAADLADRAAADARELSRTILRPVSDTRVDRSA
jgi:DNA-binding MarR family transcriptional regulator